MKYSILLFSLCLLLSCDLPFLNDEDWSAEETNIKIVQLADLHITEEKDIFENTINNINSINPGILVFTGDQIESTESIELMKDYFLKIDLDCPKYAILGNWEYWGNVDLEEYREALNDCGITLLVNEQVSMVIKDQPVSIYGLDDYLGGQPSFDNYTVNQDDLNIVLGHCPVLFDSLQSTYSSNTNKFYMLSGHTHGGQITFFGIPLYLPEGSGKYCSGIYTEGNFNLFVSKGIGNSTVDFRVFSNPQIEIISF